MHLLAQSETGNLSGIVRDFKNHTSKKFLEVLFDPAESRLEWMKFIIEYHGKHKNNELRGTG